MAFLEIGFITDPDGIPFVAIGIIQFYPSSQSQPFRGGPVSVQPAVFLEITSIQQKPIAVFSGS